MLVNFDSMDDHVEYKHITAVLYVVRTPTNPHIVKLTRSLMLLLMYTYVQRCTDLSVLRNGKLNTTAFTMP